MTTNIKSRELHPEYLLTLYNKYIKCEHGKKLPANRSYDIPYHNRTNVLCHDPALSRNELNRELNN
jgi:hypothetical protein